MMQKLDDFGVMGALCKAASKWGIMASWAGDGDAEWLKAIPWVDPIEDFHSFLDGKIYCLFDSEAEMIEHYLRVVGDDGPTRLNSYSGPRRVYACTFSPDGRILTENT